MLQNSFKKAWNTIIWPWYTGSSEVRTVRQLLDWPLSCKALIPWPVYIYSLFTALCASPGGREKPSSSKSVTVPASGFRALPFSLPSSQPLCPPVCAPTGREAVVKEVKYLLQVSACGPCLRVPGTHVGEGLPHTVLRHLWGMWGGWW